MAHAGVDRLLRGYVAAIVYVATGLDAGAGDVVLVARRRQPPVGLRRRGGRRDRVPARHLARLRPAPGLAGGLRRRGRRPTPTPPSPERITEAITFEHVSFTYPGTDREVLSDVDLRLPAGTVVAVVGENGAGKTTLVKLLAGLYEPTAGAHRASTAPTCAGFHPTSGARASPARFQDFARFELPATRRRRARRSDHARRSRRRRARASTGPAPTTWSTGSPHGLDTQLGAHWEDGVDLSYGQWQKVALARGFMRDEPLLVVLDEPTAALDAETEHDLFARYAAHAGVTRRPAVG